MEQDSKNIINESKHMEDIVYEIVFDKNRTYLFYSNGNVLEMHTKKMFKSNLLYELYKKYGVICPLSIDLNKDYHIIELHDLDGKIYKTYKLPLDFYFINKLIDVYVLNKKGDNVFTLKNMLKLNDSSVKLGFLVLKYFIGTPGLNATCIINQKGEFKWYKDIDCEEKFIIEVHSKKYKNNR